MGACKSFIRLFHTKRRAVLSARPFLAHHKLIKLDEGSDYRLSISIKNKSIMFQIVQYSFKYILHIIILIYLSKQCLRWSLLMRDMIFMS